jgi:hypothetical protein
MPGKQGLDGPTASRMEADLSLYERLERGLVRKRLVRHVVTNLVGVLHPPPERQRMFEIDWLEDDEPRPA